MLSFASDYIDGAHEEILRRIGELNHAHLEGYGADPYCQSAREKIRMACGCPEAEVFFLVGGTQTNQVVIDTMLAPYQGVAAAQSGHVSLHEAGAIEFTGHKVLTLPEHQGKIDAAQLQEMVETFYGDGNHEHMVFPGMVYLSYPTEYGTLYTREELQEIRRVCDAFHLPLFIDGARLGYGLASTSSDLDFKTLASLCDVFYIGGTKVGALCGEAVVFPKGKMPPHFMTQVKQHGALLAKGFLLGIQFDTLFTDDLYLKISRQAIETAEMLRRVLHELNIPFYLESPTNQQFILLENQQYEKLQSQVGCSFWESYDAAHTVVRLATSWATRQEDVKALAEIMRALL